MYDDEYGSASAEVINVIAVCTLTKVETKNVKVPDIFYFLNESTIKKGNDNFYKVIKEFSKFDYI